jgi:hypothetical protein
MYAGGLNLYRSNVGGGSWSNLGSLGAKALSMDASFTSPDTMYVGTVPITNGQNARIYRVTNNTVVDVSGGQIPNRYPTDIHVDPNNSRIVYAAFGGFGTGHVFKTTNGGANWTDITGNLPDVPHQSVCIDPLYPQNVYVGSDLGVYVTTNSGANWYEFRTGMPYALVFDLKVVYPARKLRAATHGSGAYQRDLVPNPVGITPIGSEVPKEFKLSQNYPNPFNPSTKIRFAVAKQSNVKITVYDITGRLITTLVNENLRPSNYEIKFDAGGISSGVYFYRLETSGFADTKKMVIVK